MTTVHTKLFSGPVTFLRPVQNLKELPDESFPEVAFAGRSNVGKSSMINFLFGNRSVAKTSSTPGRTQALNFFQLGNSEFRFVDMPGYGYAKAPKALVDSWNDLLKLYLKGRFQLQRVFLLIDARHGLKPNDLEIMKLLDDAAVTYQIILTKVDKISSNALEVLKETIVAKMSKHPALFPQILETSVLKNIGREQVQEAFYQALHARAL